MDRISYMAAKMLAISEVSFMAQHQCHMHTFHYISNQIKSKITFVEHIYESL